MCESDDVTMVSNPAYERLEALRSRVNINRWGMQTSLDRANERMQDGKTWTGSTAAQPWAEELEGRASSLPDMLDGVIEAIESRMNAVPEEVPETGLSNYGHYLPM